MLKRIIILFINRNREFYRDRSGLGWNILFPFFIIVGFSLIFSQDSRSEYKAGLINTGSIKKEISAQYEQFREIKIIEFVEMDSLDSGLNRLLHHRIDILIDPALGKYWKSTTSPKGFIVEKLLIASGKSSDRSSFLRGSVKGREIPYIEWLFPGVLAMNMMFSALFGVGYTVVRYRKNGVLKRFSVTLLSPFEFLTAQVLSRMFVIFLTTGIVYTACAAIYGFENRGSYASLLLLFLLGSFSMISLALIIASRSSSEEFAGGALNLLSWPMMFLSEVWFSMEGARPWVITLSKFLPLTHLTAGVRKIMNDGATLYEIKAHVIALTVMSVLFMATGSLLFRWQKED
ncbi:MAG TPA: ABC transporter permease [Spirochaetota bacterium]|nr:ABC transporter permease [Spirochaetota bacterium]HPJ34118.1 ABC transporter permease [Spirochaetota bacterium]